MALELDTALARDWDRYLPGRPPSPAQQTAGLVALASPRPHDDRIQPAVREESRKAVCCVEGFDHDGREVGRIDRDETTRRLRRELKLLSRSNRRKG